MLTVFIYTDCFLAGTNFLIKNLIAISRIFSGNIREWTVRTEVLLVVHTKHTKINFSTFFKSEFINFPLILRKYPQNTKTTKTWNKKKTEKQERK